MAHLLREVVFEHHRDGMHQMARQFLSSIQRNRSFPHISLPAGQSCSSLVFEQVFLGSHFHAGTRCWTLHLAPEKNALAQDLPLQKKAAQSPPLIT